MILSHARTPFSVGRYDDPTHPLKRYGPYEAADYYQNTIKDAQYPRYAASLILSFAWEYI